MKTLVDLAVANNIAWCGIVCHTHGIAHISKGNVWGLRAKAPAFYPDIITNNSKVTTEEVMDFIGGGEVSGIKDSYANLDLASHGFKMLFEADWIYHAPVKEAGPAQRSWLTVATEEELKEWSDANGTGTVIRPELLRRNDVKIFMHRDQDQRSGFIAYLGADAVGVSNVFSTGQAEESMWTDIVKVVSAAFPGFPMVGYERNGSLEAARASGWTPIGPLRVWVK
uniref:Uncharacterized protein n=2 Tax=Cohnella candidum TaxID=2674991 RepID=A0A3G3K1R0_9BACL|nr:hypothetical protein EAV92_18600 [Cohnella candidum]